MGLQTAGEQDGKSLSLKELFHQLLPDEIPWTSSSAGKKDVEEGAQSSQASPDNICFVGGRVTAQLEYTDRPTDWNRHAGTSWRVVYLRQKRTAAVVADEPSVVYVLSADSLATMERDSPGVASYFHQLIIKLLAERTTHLIRTVAALEK
jgi:CRP-like cAMP-binding protein